MNKTVKHCEVCSENFGDRFSFCPVCGETLKAVGVGEPEAFPASVNNGDSAYVGEQREERIVAASTASTLTGEGAPAFVQREPHSANGSINFKTNGAVTSDVTDDDYFASAELKTESDAIENFEIDGMPYHSDGLYHLTILQDMNRERGLNMVNGAFLGLILLIAIGTGYWVWELYQTDLNVEAIVSEEVLRAYVDNSDPIEEEKEPVRKNEDKGGGGGGGGKKDPEVQKGIMPQMSRDKQEIAPDVERVIKPNFELKQAPKLEGPPQPVNKSWEQYGVINGSKNIGGGMGEGRGLGNGRGSGIGNGEGTGYGNGRGSGIGNGVGNGIGDGKGDGDSGEPPPVKKAAPPVTEPLQILSKPSPKFTEEARKQNIKGTVLLRVTFSASGQVTGISPVRGLGGGLTEQAIAAARLIKFKPMLKNGQAVSVVKTIEYNFNMY